MLKPEKMEKIIIISLNKYRDVIVRDLHELGAMQVEDSGEKISSVFNKRYENSMYKDVYNYLQKFRGYLSMLPKREIRSRARFKGIDDLISKIESIKIENDLNEIKDNEDKLIALKRDLENNIKPLEIMHNLDYDLSIFNNDHVKSVVIEEPALPFIGDCNRCVSKIKLNNFYLIIVEKNAYDNLISRLPQNYIIMPVPEGSGKIGDVLASWKNELLNVNNKLNDLNKRLNEISDKWYETIAQISEELEIYANEYDVESELASSDSAFAITGWIPVAMEKTINEVLSRDSNNEIYIKRIETDEEPPTLLKNTKRLKIFEFFVRFYSLPREYEIDPTIIFAIVFPVFFGLMVGDAGYSLVILLISLFIIHRVDHPVQRSHIPKFLSRFVLTIMSKNSLKTLAKALIPGSIIGIIVGIIFNEFFGFTIYPRPFVANPRPFPIVYIGKLLLISGYIGLAMVIFGFILGIINNVYINKRREAVAKFGWILLALGIADIGLNLLHRISLSPDVLSSLIGYIMIVLGFILILIFEGRQSLMEIPSIISHILSYTRLVGILLATVVLALVINRVFVSTLSMPFYFIILGVIILAIGQIFNLIISVFEPGIQGARLIYVEFFSKFYFGNGKPFRPFAANRKYTEKDNER
ncbi:V-type ATP synthase subunit I [Picrophilus oshimae]|uniref:A-type ATP synthase subunit I n=1 Tax=Picrophilus torridus (strain ATCC 700027 / DSM 9790 / JCM 10055 / NBRC 100828 / KAW 2/3) TaxID=1122961 RepID=Q6L1T1_PICTO|nr:V-type ATP synthase subunit I [Picrophilus oshimae]AAT43071.1 A1AO H+ ATPase subunit I [Picrophilus oshimae DSM 9789]